MRRKSPDRELPATTIFPSDWMATVWALFLVPTAVVTFPSPLNVVSSVPFELYRKRVTALLDAPAATIFPSDCIATALTTPRIPSVVTSPSPSQLVSRSPGAACTVCARLSVKRKTHINSITAALTYEYRILIIIFTSLNRSLTNSYISSPKSPHHNKNGHKNIKWD